MDMMVDVLATNLGCSRSSLTSSAGLGLVLELCSLLLQTRLDVTVIPVLELAVLDTNKVVMVLFGENLAVVHRLHRGVIVILVDLLVDGGSDLLVLLGFHRLMLDSRSDILVDGGVVVTGLAHKVGNGSLGFLHYCSCSDVVSGVGVKI